MTEYLATPPRTDEPAEGPRAIDAPDGRSRAVVDAVLPEAVSYTHLTLPTILLV